MTKQFMLVSKEGHCCNKVYHISMRQRKFLFFWTSWQYLHEIYIDNKGWTGEYRIGESGWFCQFNQALESLKRIKKYDQTAAIPPN